MFQDFFKGINTYARAFNLLSEMRLWAYLILPGIMGLLLAILIGGTAWSLYDDLGAFFLSWLPTAGNGWITSVSNFLSGLLILTSGILLFKHLLLVVLSPFMSPLAQKVEEHLTGRKSPYSGLQIGQAIKDIIRGLRIAFRNIIREVFFSALLLILSLIPAVGVFSAVLLFLVQAFYAGFGNMDYTLERHYSVRESVQFIRSNRGLALGNGTVFVLLLSTGIGVLIAPTLATIAGAIATVERLEGAEVDFNPIKDYV